MTGERATAGGRAAAGPNASPVRGAPLSGSEPELAALFEGAPRFLARLAADGPHASWDALFAHARAIAHAMPEDEQVELIDAHPRLGAPPTELSALSYREQGYDRPDRPSELAQELERLNVLYESRFGFRYCVFVAGRPRAALLPEFRVALDAERDAELHRALDAVVDIAIARHAALSGRSPSATDPRDDLGR